MAKFSQAELDRVCERCNCRYGMHMIDRCPEGSGTFISPKLSTPAPAPAPTRATTIPTDPAERKKYPIATGFLNYFPDAIVAVAHVSWVGNNQHNPGEPLHWARGKSMDQDDTMARHFLERGGGNVSGFDTDGVRHLAKAAWRVMAALQLEIEEEQRRAKQAV